MRARGSASPETREEDEEYSKGKKTGVMKYVGEVEVHTHLQLCTHTIPNVHTHSSLKFDAFGNVCLRCLQLALVLHIIHENYLCIRQNHLSNTGNNGEDK